MDAQAAELAAAIAEHQAGQLTRAQARYQQMLVRDPQDVNALHLLGVLASQQGRLEAAVDLIGRAVARAGRHPLMLFNLANVLKDQGHLAAAIDHYREALSHDPRFALAHLNLGEALCQQHRDAEAIPSFERALELDAGLANAHFQLAGALARLARLEPSRQHYERALELDPANFAAGNNLGAVCVEMGDFAAAARAYNLALAAAPDCMEAHFNLGALDNKQHRYQTAETHFRRAVALRPEATQGHAALAETLHFQGRTAEARTHLVRAAELQPKNLIWQLRPTILCPFVFPDNEAIDEHRRVAAARLDALSESVGQQLTFDLGELGDSRCHPPVSWAYQGRDDLPLKTRFAELFASRLPGSLRPLDKQRSLAGAPHVGFLVTAGNEGVFLRGMAGLVARLNARRFRVTVVCAPAAVASCRQAIGNPAVSFMPLPKPFLSAVEAIRSVRFDLLYYWEIGSDAVNYFLPMLRLAPVQCTSWGWPVTSGIPTVDYFLSSELLEPVDGASHYRETLVRLAHIPNYYECPPTAPAADRSKFGWSREQHVYFCGQSPRKIQPDFDLLVGDILRADPQGVVALVSATLDPVTEALKARFSQRLGDVAGRIQFVPRMSAAEYRGLTAAADVVLDTLHYSGGANSTYDTIASGKSLVTLAGRYHRGRYTAAVCRLLGLEECVAASPGDYVRIAVKLATERDYREAIERRMRERREVLFGNVAAVDELADFFERAIVAARNSGSSA